MSVYDSTYDQIEAYLNGEMSVEEQHSFATQLASDKALAEQVEKHKLANALVIEQRLFQVKNILHEEQVKNSNPTNYKLYAITALAIIGSTIAVVLYKNSDTAKTTSSVVNPTQSTNTASGVPVNKNADRYSTVETVQPVSGTELHKQEIEVYEQAMREGTYTAAQPQIDSAVSVKKEESKIVVNPVVVNAVAVQDVCASTVIKGDIKTTATCSHEASGNVVVANIQGGAKPYAISIENANREASINGQLTAGIYQIIITDAHACEKKYTNIQIGEKECAVDYSFNPFMGEKWEVKAHNTSGLLQIYNKGGVLCYQTTIDANTSFEWSGAGNSNQIQPGYYIFMINYSDGTAKKGSVTIVQ